MVCDAVGDPAATAGLGAGAVAADQGSYHRNSVEGEWNWPNGKDDD
jgi:hypothetical protein